MSTVDLADAGIERSARPRQGRPAIAARSAGAPFALAGALLLVILYAAFAHGAVRESDDAQIQVALALLAAFAAAAWLWTGALRLAAPRFAIAGLALLTAFAVWSGITLAWSVAPDQTWLELNRGLGYALALALAIAVGASSTRSIEVVAKGYLLVALVVACYALGQKLVPGLHLTGVFNLDQTGPLPRLQEPLGYWNALALLLVLAVPIAFALAIDRVAPLPLRIAALVTAVLMMLAIAFTYSRGGVLALVFALAVTVTTSGERLRSLMWIGVACLAAVPPLILGLTNHALTSAGVGLGAREGAGGLLTAVLLVMLGALILGARTVAAIEHRVEIAPEREDDPARTDGACAGAVVAVIIVLALSSRGLGGTVAHAWRSFTTTRTTSNYDPSRLLSADSENRWVWWKKAAEAFSDRPLGGWGAGSFGVVHLLYRRDTISVQQPHSVPLQFLAETGVVGTMLAFGAFALLLLSGLGAVRRCDRGGGRLFAGRDGGGGRLFAGGDAGGGRLFAGRDADGGRLLAGRDADGGRLLAAALLGGAAAYVLHTFYDWDWDIPAVTLPGLVFLGVLAGSASPQLPGRGLSLPPPGPGIRALALGLTTVVLCAYVLSSALPSIAASQADSALVAAADPSPGALARAQAAAALASSLDPLSDAGLRAQAAIAIHRGLFVQARDYLLQALARDPSDAEAWGQLASTDAFLHDLAGLRRAVARAIALDPRGREVAGTIRELNVLEAAGARAGGGGSRMAVTVARVTGVLQPAFGWETALVKGGRERRSGGAGGPGASGPCIQAQSPHPKNLLG